MHKNFRLRSIPDSHRDENVRNSCAFENIFIFLFNFATNSLWLPHLTASYISLIKH